MESKRRMTKSQFYTSELRRQMHNEFGDVLPGGFATGLLVINIVNAYLRMGLPLREAGIIQKEAKDGDKSKAS